MAELASDQDKDDFEDDAAIIDDLLDEPEVHQQAIETQELLVAQSLPPRAESNRLSTKEEKRSRLTDPQKTTNLLTTGSPTDRLPRIFGKDELLPHESFLAIHQGRSSRILRISLQEPLKIGELWM